MNKKLYIAIGLLSASIIAFQLALMQILSISQWSHFAYMVISVALLGFGASGTALTFTKKWLILHINRSLPALLLLTTTSMGLIMLFSEQVFGGFDSYLLFLEGSHIYGLLLTYLCLFIPFFFGATAIGLVYTHYVSRIGNLYFADLFGSGMGGLLMLLLFWYFTPAVLPFVIALLPLAAALLLIKRNQWKSHAVFLLPAIFVLFYGSIHPVKIPMSQYKSLSRSLLLPDAIILDEKISPYGQLQLLRAPGMRYAPGLSLNYTGKIPVQEALFNNGNWFGPLIDFTNKDSVHFLDYATNALPFILSKPEKVFIPEAGTGLYAAHALSHGAKKITAVASNGAAIELLKKNLPMPPEAIQFVHRDPRSYLMGDSGSYDLIILPLIESFGGSSGIHALQEQYLFTKQAFTEMWQHLSDEGMIAVTVWMDYPARNSLKMLATLAESLQNVDPTKVAANHIMAIRSWGTVTFVLKKSPVTPQETTKIRAFCLLRNFDPLLLPNLKTPERAHFNQLQEVAFFDLTDQLMTGDREALYHNYDFQIRPATDSKPYFSQFLKLDRLSKMKDIFGQGSVPFLEVGYLIVLLTFFQISVAAILLILIPLFFIGFKGGKKVFTVIHFSGIGIGFMFVEMMLIQQFTLYFGHPIYAASAVLSGMLLFAGLGAFLSEKLIKNKRSFILFLAAIIFFIVLLAFVLTPLIRASMSQPMVLKILIAMLAIGPLAFLLGLPFPAGLRLLAKHNENLIPWAWGINGCFSVISTALASLIVVAFGFLTVMLIAALAYFGTLLVQVSLAHKT